MPTDKLLHLLAGVQYLRQALRGQDSGGGTVR